MRRTTATLALCFLLGFYACTKPPIRPADPPPADPAKITLKRNLALSGTVQSDTLYAQGNGRAATASYEGARFEMLLPFDNGKRGYRDVVRFIKEAAPLPTDLSGTYSLNSADYPRCWSTSYSIEYVHPDDYKEFRYAVTEFGHEMSGTLTIDHYDPATELVSGSYKAVVRGLSQNPLNQYPVLTTGPATISLEGTFKDVKVHRH